MKKWFAKESVFYLGVNRKTVSIIFAVCVIVLTGLALVSPYPKFWPLGTFFGLCLGHVGTLLYDM